MAAGAISRLSSAAPSVARRFFGVSVARRAFGSSAAARLDDDDDYYYSDCEEEERNRSELVDAVGWVPPRGVQWVVIGDRGVKKNFYAQRLSKLLEVPHISMGTLLRHELNPGSSIYKKIANAVSEGKLVPEDIIFSLLSKRLEEGYNRGENGFILDGIPRSRLQAEILDQIADVDLVVNLKSGKIAQRNNLATGNLNLLSEISDSKELYNQKLVYTKQSQALEDYYRKQRKIVDFEVTGQPSDTWQGLLAVLRLQNINAISSSSQKLTA